jgi:hypothetical protein
VVPHSCATQIRHSARRCHIQNTFTEAPLCKKEEDIDKWIRRRAGQFNGKGAPFTLISVGLKPKLFVLFLPKLFVKVRREFSFHKIMFYLMNMNIQMLTRK